MTVTIHELIGARRVGKSTIAESFAMPQAVEVIKIGNPVCSTLDLDKFKGE